MDGSGLVQAREWFTGDSWNDERSASGSSVVECMAGSQVYVELCDHHDNKVWGEPDSPATTFSGFML